MAQNSYGTRESSRPQYNVSPTENATRPASIAWLPLAVAAAEVDRLADLAIGDATRPGDEMALSRVALHLDLIRDRLEQAIFEIEQYSPGLLAQRRELEREA